MESLEQYLASKQPAKPKKNDRHSRMRALSITLVVFICLILLGIGLTYAYKNVFSSSELPISIVRDVPFTVYYPEKLPANTTLTKDSVSYKNGIILYTLTHNGKNSIVITQQQKDKNFVLKDFTKGQGLQDGRDIRVSGSPAITGTVLGRQIYIIAKQDTIISVVSSEPSMTDALDDSLDTLVPTK